MSRLGLPDPKPVLYRIMHLAVCVAIVVSLPAAAQETAENNTMFWSTTLKMIRAKFPGVAQLSTDSLQVWLEAAPDRPGRESPLLLDVREREEYEDRPVVLYCSVGYRSSEMAGYLQKRGFDKVYNLEGSIFAWANEGRPVYRGGERVHEVHPYDRVWGRLLKKTLRARQAGGK